MVGLLSSPPRRTLRGLLDPDPNYEYGTMLPLAKNRGTGELSLAVPGVVRGPIQGLLGLYDEFRSAVEGEGFDPEKVTEGALAMPAAGALVDTPAGAIGANMTPYKTAAIAKIKEQYRSVMDYVEHMANRADTTPEQAIKLKANLSELGQKLQNEIDAVPDVKPPPPNLAGPSKDIVRRMHEADPERMARAKEQGFDTSRVWWHGSPDIKDFTEFNMEADPNSLYGGMGAAHFASHPEGATAYTERADQIPRDTDQPGLIPTFLRMGKTKTYNAKGEHASEDVPYWTESAFNRGHDSLLIKNIRDDELMNQAIVNDPSNIRSIFAQFRDPESSSLLAANKGKVQSITGAGLLADRPSPIGANMIKRTVRKLDQKAYDDAYREVYNFRRKLHGERYQSTNINDLKQTYGNNWHENPEAIAKYQAQIKEENAYRNELEKLYPNPNESDYMVDAPVKPSKRVEPTRDELNEILAKGRTATTKAEQTDAGQELLKRMWETDPERMQRAKEMGFDTDNLWFHGSPAVDKVNEFSNEFLGSQFDTQADTAGGHFFASHPALANKYTNYNAQEDATEGVIPVLLRGEHSFWKSTPKNDDWSETIANRLKKTQETGKDIAIMPDDIGTKAHVAAVSDPSNIRSIFAQFRDPESSSLLAANKGPLGGLLAGVSNPYETQLTPEEEPRFTRWADKISKLRKSNILRDTRDYDVYGAFRAGLQPDDRGHLDDTYKKPNHITFSNESVYHGQNGEQGGEWIQAPNGQWNFKVGPTNLKYHSREEIEDYFKNYEPDSKVMFP